MEEKEEKEEEEEEEEQRSSFTKYAKILTSNRQGTVSYVSNMSYVMSKVVSSCVIMLLKFPIPVPYVPLAYDPVPYVSSILFMSCPMFPLSGSLFLESCPMS